MVMIQKEFCDLIQTMVPKNLWTFFIQIYLSNESINLALIDMMFIRHEVHSEKSVLQLFFFLKAFEARTFEDVVKMSMSAFYTYIQDEAATAKVYFGLKKWSWERV